jgi:hypothetical protein
MSRAANLYTGQIRFRRGQHKAVDELRVMLGGLSRDDMIFQLLRHGLLAEYARMGIERDPADTAVELLTVILENWRGDMSDDELAAFDTVRKALERITEIRARENKAGD